MSSVFLLGFLFVGAIVLVLFIGIVLALLLQLRRNREEAGVLRLDPPAQAVELDDAALTRLQLLLAQNKSLEALKFVREQSGLGLNEAKDYVERIRSGITMPARSKQAQIGSASDPQAIEQQARALLASGKRLTAIKRVRELSGLRLEEARDYVDALQAGTAPVLLPVTPAAPLEPVDETQLAAIALELLGKGRKLEAIKRVRELTGWDLNRAKEFVDRL